FSREPSADCDGSILRKPTGGSRHACHERGTNWRTAVLIVKPETVIAWHRQGFRLFWTWKSRCRTGRPPRIAATPIDDAIASAPLRMAAVHPIPARCFRGVRLKESHAEISGRQLPDDLLAERPRDLQDSLGEDAC